MVLLLAWAAPAQAAVTSGTITFSSDSGGAFITAPILGIAFNDTNPWIYYEKSSGSKCSACPSYMATPDNGGAGPNNPSTGTLKAATNGDTFNLKGFKAYDWGDDSGSYVTFGGGLNTKLTVTPYDAAGTAGTPTVLTLTQTGLAHYPLALYNVSRVDITSDQNWWFTIFEIEVEAGTATPTVPTVTPGNIGLTGANGTGGIYKIGDTVTATWNNAASGDNNSGITGVTMNFSQFGGGTAVTATESGGIWTATYTITAGSIQQTSNRNVSVTATSSGGSTTTVGANNAVVDNVLPGVSSIAVKGTPAAGDTSMVFTVTFNESVLNLSTDDFTLVGTGASGNIARVSANSGTSVDVTIAGIAGSGTLKIQLNGSTNVIDVAGNGPPASYSSGTTHSVAIPVAPGAPTIGTAIAGNGQATVSFTAPANDGDATITGYTVTSNPGGLTGTGSSSPITVMGLTNGTAYTFTVTATNSKGTGGASGASNSVTPKAAQTITFNNPGPQNFGTTPTLTASTSSGLAVTFTSTTPSVCTISSSGTLTFVSAGTCTIDADQAGNSAWLAATTVPQSFTVSAVAPSAPTVGAVTEGDTSASVAFTAPSNNGGAAITSYTVTSSPGGLTGTGSSSPITVTGLTNGTTYTFTVTATNSAGTSSASAASSAVTPKGSQTITFTNPGTQNFGTTPTLTASTSSGLAVTFTSTTPSVCTISSSGVLTFAAVGLCTIEASQAGDDTWLAATVSQSFTVSAVAPGAPTIGTATAGDTQATVTFTAPASNGGTAITGYTVTSSPGGLTGTGASSPITVSGLDNGTTYTFTVAATNGAGVGAASAASNSVMPSTVVQGTVPTPTTGTGTTGTATATVGALDTAQDPNCRLAAALFASEVPPGYTVSYGSFEFEATNCQHGVTISLTYPQALPLGVRFMKFGPPSSGAPDDWMDWTSLVTVSADRKTVTYSVLDNGAGDSDTRKGFVADPIIPAALGAPGPVSPAAIPTLGHWALVLLSALVGGLAWRRKTGASA